MEITICREYEFVPEWNGNRGETVPVTFKLKMLTTGERDKLMGYEFNSDGSVHLMPDRQGMFSTAVIRIDNLKVNGESITNARQLLSCPGLDSLFTEAVGEIMSKNARLDVKN